eukprot:3899916-Amphidinium_carterae.2
MEMESKGKSHSRNERYNASVCNSILGSRKRRQHDSREVSQATAFVLWYPIATKNLTYSTFHLSMLHAFAISKPRSQLELKFLQK